MKIGIVGGLGPESTVEYYKRIIKQYQNLKKNDSYPEIIIDSINMTKVLKLIEDNNLNELVKILCNSINNLIICQADIALIASNTPHVVFNEVQQKSPISLVNIVEETCNVCDTLGLNTVGLMGTSYTMRGSFYQKSLEKAGIKLITPHDKEQIFIQHTLFSEIELGIINPSTKKQYLSIVQGMIDEYGIEGIILGCTELPLIIDQKDCSIPVLDTMDIHIDGLIKRILH